MSTKLGPVIDVGIVRANFVLHPTSSCNMSRTTGSSTLYKERIM